MSTTQLSQTECQRLSELVREQFRQMKVLGQTDLDIQQEEMNERDLFYWVSQIHKIDPKRIEFIYLNGNTVVWLVHHHFLDLTNELIQEIIVNNNHELFKTIIPYISDPCLQEALHFAVEHDLETTATNIVERNIEFSVVVNPDKLWKMRVLFKSNVTIKVNKTFNVRSK